MHAELYMTVKYFLHFSSVSNVYAKIVSFPFNLMYLFYTLVKRFHLQKHQALNN